jgi:stage II sporulation protein AA (anti-sigma F factor antagonist)
VTENFQWTDTALARVERPEPDVAVVVLLGEHDMATAQDLRHLLGRLHEEKLGIVIDLSEAQFVDSSILNQLVAAHQEATKLGTEVVLQLGPTSIVRRAVEVSGLNERLPCADDRADAVRKARGETDNS